MNQHQSERIDRLLVTRGLVSTRGRAVRLLEQRRVRLNGVVVTKPSRLVGQGDALDVDHPEELAVSRSARKLEHAFRTWPQLQHHIHGQRCIDVGASTGGFTETLLRYGASAVEAIDVGTGQLHARLRVDPRVHDHSGVSVRGIDSQLVGGPASCVVVDVSFISLTTIMGDLHRLCAPSGVLVTLIKPQFEVGRERLGKRGLVKGSTDVTDALGRVVEAAHSMGRWLGGCVASPLRGKTGNAEFLAWWSDAPEDAQPLAAVHAAVAQVDSIPTFGETHE